MAFLELRGIRKEFGACIANDSVDLSIAQGSIHAIIGENGAGKSTAMKMLYGIYPPTSGEIFLDGKLRAWQSPRDAIAAGIGMVHQHFMLAGPFSVLDNIILGVEPTAKWSAWLPRALRWADRSAARKKIQTIMERYGLPVDLDAPIEKISVGLQQRVEILKLLYRDSEILILDEPTAVLTPLEIEGLFENLRRLRREGKTVLIITHKLKEVMALADAVSVFRAGRVVGERTVEKTSVQDLAELMVGRKVLLRVSETQPCQPRERVLQLANVNSSRLKNLSLHVCAGEIVGIAGVEGNGQSELIRALLFSGSGEYPVSGDLQLLGRNLQELSARAVRDLGVGVLAEDRLHESLLLKNPLWENYLLGHHWSAKFQQHGFVDARAVRRATKEAMEVFDVRPRRMDLPASALSGGNQQKFVVARELGFAPKFLIAAQPTRGVDVGAIEFIHRKIFETRDGGAAVLLVSSELDEILALSDRILVMYGGAIAAEFSRGQATEKEIGFFMGGGSRA